MPVRNPPPKPTRDNMPTSDRTPVILLNDHEKVVARKFFPNVPTREAYARYQQNTERFEDA